VGKTVGGVPDRAAEGVAVGTAVRASQIASATVAARAWAGACVTVSQSVPGVVELIAAVIVLIIARQAVAVSVPVNATQAANSMAAWRATFPTGC
jgi:ribosome maturation protein Sdo1